MVNVKGMTTTIVLVSVAFIIIGGLIPTLLDSMDTIGNQNDSEGNEIAVAGLFKSTGVLPIIFFAGLLLLAVGVFLGFGGGRK